MAQSEECVAIVAGCTGINGGNLVAHLLSSKLCNWRVIGVSNSAPKEWKWFNHPKVSHISVDLMDRNDCESKLNTALVKRAKYFYFAAYKPGKDDNEEVEINTTMFKNCLDAVEDNCPDLLKVCLFTGNKYYGVHKGPYKTPAKEDDPRHQGSNYYFNQEDLLAERQKNKQWNYTVLRPNEVLGFSPHGAMNFAQTLAIYASIVKEAGDKLVYPGTPVSYGKLYDMSDSELLSSMMEWASLSDSIKVQNQAFNAVNGDCFRWMYLWPSMAKHFGVEAVGPKEGKRFSVKEYFSTKGDLWKSMCAKYNLVPTELDKVASPSFLDWSCSREYDSVTDMNKARDAGFLEFHDTEKVFYQTFDELKALKIIP